VKRWLLIPGADLAAVKQDKLAPHIAFVVFENAFCQQATTLSNRFAVKTLV
jgi:hypothetical protein